MEIPNEQRKTIQQTIYVGTHCTALRTLGYVNRIQHTCSKYVHFREGKHCLGWRDEKVPKDDRRKTVLLNNCENLTEPCVDQLVNTLIKTTYCPNLAQFNNPVHTDTTTLTRTSWIRSYCPHPTNLLKRWLYRPYRLVIWTGRKFRLRKRYFWTSIVKY